MKINDCVFCGSKPMVGEIPNRQVLVDGFLRFNYRAICPKSGCPYSYTAKSWWTLEEARADWNENNPEGVMFLDFFKLNRTYFVHAKDGLAYREELDLKDFNNFMVCVRHEQVITKNFLIGVLGDNLKSDSVIILKRNPDFKRLNSPVTFSHLDLACPKPI